MRFYIYCPFDEKEEAKKLGAKWDKDVREWYYIADKPDSRFDRWQNTNEPEPQRDENGGIKCDVIKRSNRPKDVLEFCGDIEGMPSMVLFGNFRGVRYGYVAVPAEVAKQVENNADLLTMTLRMPDNKFYNEVYKEQTGISLGNDIRWIGYDCGHSGETCDEQAVRKYFPEEADEIIERAREIEFGEYSTSRSLLWCKALNASIANSAKEFMKEHQKNKENFERL